jgi:hypothetical protein
VRKRKRALGFVVKQGDEFVPVAAADAGLAGNRKQRRIVERRLARQLRKSGIRHVLVLRPEQAEELLPPGAPES